MFSLFSRKKDPPNKENYAPVNLLSNMSKVFERPLYINKSKISLVRKYHLNFVVSVKTTIPNIV